MQVNPDEDSRQRLRMIRGEIDQPMRSEVPGRAVQQELAQQETAQAAQDAGTDAPSRAAADSAAAPAQPEAAPEAPAHADEDNDSDMDDEGKIEADRPMSGSVYAWSWPIENNVHASQSKALKLFCLKCLLMCRRS